MTDFAEIVVVFSAEYIIFDDYTLLVSGIMHVTCII